MQTQGNNGFYAKKETVSEAISVNQVEDDQRMAFLPAMFGTRYMMRGEGLVYAWMRRLDREYNGGFWNFYRLSNGGFYLAPTGEASVAISVWGNGFEGSMTANAAGIVACMFALNQLASEVANSGGNADDIIDHYHQLREYAGEHPEAQKILSAID